MRVIHRLVGLAAIVTGTAACHGECYTVRSAWGSGHFGDTLVAVSGNGTIPGNVRFEMYEQTESSHDYRYASYALNFTGVVDTVALVRLTLVSDPARVPVLSSPVETFAVPLLRHLPEPDTAAFNTLFVHIATEDVLFEVVGKNGEVRKALLNLESRQGPKEACEPWT